MKNSAIEWCDHTFNPWEGCTKVSPGCAHCYAEARNSRFGGGTAPNWGPGAPRRRTGAANWHGPNNWNAAYEDALIYREEALLVAPPGSTLPEAPRRPRVFCASLADWLDDEIDPMWLADLLRLIEDTPNLDWLLLTKRPQNFQARMEAVKDVDGDSLAWSWMNGNAPRNIWVGTTVEDQIRANERIPLLTKIHAKVHFLSCEPMLEALDLQYPADLWPQGPATCCSGFECACGGRPVDPPLIWGINWVICGGESGPGARPMDPRWARSLRDQCKAMNVPFLFKQWGEWLPYGHGTAYMDKFRECRQVAGPDGSWPVYHVGKKAAGRLLDGVEYNEFPQL